MTGLPVTLVIIAFAVIVFWPTVESVILSIQKEERYRRGDGRATVEYSNRD